MTCRSLAVALVASCGACAAVSPPSAAEPQQSCAEPVVKAKLLTPLEVSKIAALAQAAHVEGNVRVRVAVDVDGRGTVTELLDALGHGVDGEVIRAISALKFAPATQCGTVVPGSLILSIRLRTAPEGPRPAGLAQSAAWRCPFPPESDAAKVDRAVVSLRVTVERDGTASDVAIVEDSGYGFGRAARECALAAHYSPALDQQGVPIRSSTVVNVRFAR
jgi:outer membrane biosynthesis protein TonB